jgi:hypothetical protein
MSLHLDYADENFRDAWIASTNDPAAIKALAIGGRALVKSGRELERLAEQVHKLQRDVAQWRSLGLHDSVGPSALKQVGDVMITATAQCGRCEGAVRAAAPLMTQIGSAGRSCCLATPRRSAIVWGPASRHATWAASGRQAVILTFSEYESLRRTGAGMLAELEPLTFAELVQNPRRIVEISDRELLEIARQEYRQPLVRSVQHAYREVRREYGASIRAAQARHQAGNRAISEHDPLYLRIQNLLRDGKRMEAALSLLRQEQARCG